MSLPTLIFGTGLLGEIPSDLPSTLAFKETLKSLSISHIDTAGRYPSINSGASERLLGEAKFAEDGFVIDTKILVEGYSADFTLGEENIGKSIEKSLRVLGLEKINTLYSHGPDPKTPIAQQAETFEKHHRLGHFETLGVSNYTPDMISEWIAISDSKGWIKPTIYQGLYNLISRGYEDELFPLLRKNGMKFYAYSPLAAGFLTGKLSPTTDPETLKGTRFEVSDRNLSGRYARGMYDSPACHDAITKLRSISHKTGIAMEALALRWSRYHSALGEGDGIIFGARRTEQIVGTVEWLEMGPLGEEVAREMEGLWEGIQKGE